MLKCNMRKSVVGKNIICSTIPRVFVWIARKLAKIYSYSPTRQNYTGSKGSGELEEDMDFTFVMMLYYFRRV